MDYKQLYNKYYSRMVREGVLKAALCGLAVGFGICGIVAIGMWFSDFDGLWLAIGSLVLGFAAATPLFYFFVFKPNEKSVARKLDREGLDERVVTMQELQNDDSVMAAMQRADTSSTVNEAETAAKKSGSKLLRFKVATSVIVAASVIGGFGLSFAIVTGLSDYGIIPSGWEVFGAMFPGSIPSYSVNYTLDGNAELTGNSTQRVKQGGNTDTVLYTGNHYAYFVQWVDGNAVVYKDGPTRTETNVTDNIKMVIKFGNVDPTDPDNDISRFVRIGGVGNNNNSGGGGIDQNDNIWDNEKYYGDDFDTYYKNMQEYLAQHPDLSAEERAMIEAYFEFLKLGADSNNESNP